MPYLRFFYPIYKNNQELLLKVIDLNGKVFTSITLNNDGEYLLDTSNLPEGVFILHISDGKEVVYQTKLVLIH